MSLDGCCHVWTIPSAAPVASYRLPCPLLSLIVDRGQQAIYCGGQNGEIYELPLATQNAMEQSRHQNFEHRHGQGVQSLDVTLLVPRLVSGLFPFHWYKGNDRILLPVVRIFGRYSLSVGSEIETVSQNTDCARKEASVVSLRCIQSSTKRR